MEKFNVWYQTVSLHYKKHELKRSCVNFLLTSCFQLQPFFPPPFRRGWHDPSGHPESAVGRGAGGDVGSEDVVLPTSGPAPHPQPHPNQKGPHSPHRSAPHLLEALSSRPRQTVWDGQSSLDCQRWFNQVRTQSRTVETCGVSLIRFIIIKVLMFVFNETVSTPLNILW